MANNLHTLCGTPRGEICPYVTTQLKNLYGSSAVTQEIHAQAKSPRKNGRKLARFMLLGYVLSEF